MKLLVIVVSYKVTDLTIDDRPQEFPRVDERVVGRRHRYGYTVRFDAGSNKFEFKDRKSVV